MQQPTLQLHCSCSRRESRSTPSLPPAYCRTAERTQTHLNWIAGWDCVDQQVLFFLLDNLLNELVCQLVLRVQLVADRAHTLIVAGGRGFVVFVLAVAFGPLQGSPPLLQGVQAR